MECPFLLLRMTTLPYVHGILYAYHMITVSFVVVKEKRERCPPFTALPLAQLGFIMGPATSFTSGNSSACDVEERVYPSY